MTSLCFQRSIHRLTAINAASSCWWWHHYKTSVDMLLIIQSKAIHRLANRRGMISHFYTIMSLPYGHVSIYINRAAAFLLSITGSLVKKQNKVENDLVQAVEIIWTEHVDRSYNDALLSSTALHLRLVRHDHCLTIEVHVACSMYIYGCIIFTHFAHKI